MQELLVLVHEGLLPLKRPVGSCDMHLNLVGVNIHLTVQVN